jgi:hypothetical protein
MKHDIPAAGWIAMSLLAGTGLVAGNRLICPRSSARCLRSLLQ